MTREKVCTLGSAPRGLSGQGAESDGTECTPDPEKARAGGQRLGPVEPQPGGSTSVWGSPDESGPGRSVHRVHDGGSGGHRQSYRSWWDFSGPHRTLGLGSSLDSSHRGCGCSSCGSSSGRQKWTRFCPVPVQQRLVWSSLEPNVSQTHLTSLVEFPVDASEVKPPKPPQPGRKLCPSRTEKPSVCANREVRVPVRVPVRVQARPQTATVLGTSS